MQISTQERSLQTACLLSLVVLMLTANLARCKDTKDGSTKRKLPKDPLFMTDVDLENLYDEWEESDEEKLPYDELPPHKKQPLFKMTKGKEDELFSDPEKMMMQTKKDRTVMAFTSIAGNPTKEDTNMLTERWQVGLTNNHIKCERYVIGDNRAIFVFHDGLQAFEAKDFFLEQPELKEYSIDQRTWHGKGYPVEYPNAKGDSNDDGIAKSDTLKGKDKGNKSKPKHDEL